MQMNNTAQGDFISRIGRHSTTGSLTSTSNNGASTGKSDANANTGASVATAGGGQGPNGSDENDMSGLNATSLASACQGASPSSTLQDAFSHSLTQGANDGSGK
jgi:hypothetical protein